MGTNSYFQIILGVLKNFYVIGTVIVMILVIEFAKFVTTYRKKPRKAKVKKPKVITASAPAAEKKEEGGEESSEDSSEEKTESK